MTSHQTTCSGRSRLGWGHSPQAQLPAGRQPSQGQEVTAICRIRPWAGGTSSQVLQPVWGQLFRHCPGLGRERAGLAQPSSGLGGESPEDRRTYLSVEGVRELGPLASNGCGAGYCRARTAVLGVSSGVLNQLWVAGPTWHWCRRSRRPLVGFPQRTRLAPKEEGGARSGLGLRGCGVSFVLRWGSYHG